MAKRRRRQKVDWVVNDQGYAASTISVPVVGTHAACLVFSQQQVVESTIGLGTQDRGAFPEGGSNVVVAVRGYYHISVATNTWIAGTDIRVHTRIVNKPQDVFTGAPIVDPLYGLASAAFANERFMYNNEVRGQFVAGTAMGVWKHMVNVSVRRFLNPEEGLFLLVENRSNVDINVNCKLRTLLRVP